MKPWLLQALNPVFPKPLPRLELCFRLDIITTSLSPPHPTQERKNQKSKESNFYLVKANIFPKKPEGQGAVIRGLCGHTGISHWARTRLGTQKCPQPFSTIRTSSVERREGVSPGEGWEGYPWARRPQDHEGGRREHAHSNQPWVSFQKSHHKWPVLSVPGPLPPAVSPHPTLKQQEHSRGEKFSATPIVMSATGRRRGQFWVRVPPSCPVEGWKRTALF